MKRYQLMLLNLIMAQKVLYNTDPAAGGGGGGGNDPAAAFQRLLEQHKNDGVAVASKLFDENFQYRGQIRDLKAKAPKDGDVVLTGDDAKEYQAFKALNAKTEDLKRALDAMPELEKKNKELAGMETVRELAEVGHDGSKMKVSVLTDLLAKYPDAKITFKTEKDKDGNETKVAYIQKTDKDPVSAFTEFANTELADYLPSLKVSTEATTTTAVPPGTVADPKSKGGSASVFDKIREDVKKTSEAPVADIDTRFGRAAA
jgi:hypothetical protein